MKVIAIGGDAASMSAVSKLRRLDKAVEIDVFEMGEIVSYGACGMPYFVSDEIKESNTLMARSKESFEANNISVHLLHEVVQVNGAAKTVEVKNLTSNEVTTHQFDKLIIGSGARPNLIPVENNDLDNIFTMTTIPDSIAVKEQMQSGNIKNVVVIGAGFIGVEMVEAFSNYDVKIHLVEALDQILTVFDDDMAKYLEKHLIEKGVEIHLNEKVESFIGDQIVKAVKTNKGTYDADLVLVAAGVTPNTDFLDPNEFDLRNKAVIVNRKMETSVKDVYAAGDCALIYNRLTKEQVFLPMGNNANKQGRIVAENIHNNSVEIDGVLGTTVIKVMDLEAGRTGLSETQAKTLGIEYKTAFIKGRNHAHYYPNAQSIYVKIIYAKDSLKILGAQIIGRSDAAIRINPFVVAISAGMTTKEFSMLDFAYAPPFAGVWDVIAIAASKAK